jgi:hypothetical protein
VQHGDALSGGQPHRFGGVELLLQHHGAAPGM